MSGAITIRGVPAELKKRMLARCERNMKAGSGPTTYAALIVEAVEHYFAADKSLEAADEKRITRSTHRPSVL